MLPPPDQLHGVLPTCCQPQRSYSAIAARSPSVTASAARSSRADASLTTARRSATPTPMPRARGATKGGRPEPSLRAATRPSCTPRTTPRRRSAGAAPRVPTIRPDPRPPRRRRCLPGSATGAGLQAIATGTHRRHARARASPRTRRPLPGVGPAPSRSVASQESSHRAPRPSDDRGRTWVTSMSKRRASGELSAVWRVFRHRSG